METTRERSKLILWLPFLLLFSVLSILSLKRLISSGEDFIVLYEAAKDALLGNRIYSFEKYGVMIYKYPPWTLWFFLPFSVFPLLAAKVLFGILMIFSMAYSFREIHLKFEVRPWICFLCLFSFGTFFLLCGYVGQITPILLAVSLGLATEKGSKSSYFAVATTLSSKLLTVFPLMEWIHLKSFWKTMSLVVLGWVLLTIPWGLWNYGGDFSSLFQDYLFSIFSGEQAVEGRRVGFMTRETQGLPSLILQWTMLDPSNRMHVIFASFGPFVGVGLLWKILSRNFQFSYRWLGWLALLPTVQPMAWHHFFLMALPLFAVTYEKALQEKRLLLFVLALFFNFLLVAVTQKTMGEVGLFFEMARIKSIATLLVVCLFYYLARSSSSLQRIT